MLQEWFYTCPGIYSFIFTHESQPELGEWSLGFVKVANFYFILFFYIQYKKQIHSLSYVLTCGNTEFYLGTVLSGQSMQGQATWHPLSMNFPEFYLPRCLMHDIILSFVQSKADFFCPNLFNQSGTIIPSIVIYSVSISMWKAKRQGYQQQQPPDTTEQA